MAAAGSVGRNLLRPLCDSMAAILTAASLGAVAPGAPHTTVARLFLLANPVPIHLSTMRGTQSVRLPI